MTFLRSAEWSCQLAACCVYLSVVFFTPFHFHLCFCAQGFTPVGDTFREQEAILRARCKIVSMQPWPTHTTVGSLNSNIYTPCMYEMLELASVSLSTDSLLHDLFIRNGTLPLPITVFYSYFKLYKSNGSLFQPIKSHFLSKMKLAVMKRVKLIKANQSFSGVSLWNCFMTFTFPHTDQEFVNNHHDCLVSEPEPVYTLGPVTVSNAGCSWCFVSSTL